MATLKKFKNKIVIDCDCGNVLTLSEKDKELLLETVYSKEQREAIEKLEAEKIEDDEDEKISKHDDDSFNVFNL